MTFQLLRGRLCHHDNFRYQSCCTFFLCSLTIIGSYLRISIISWRFVRQERTQAILPMSPDMWREFIKPRLKQLVDRCHEHGLPCILHSCGNYLAILDDLIEIGVDGLESLQPEAIDVLEVKRRTMGRIFLIGGIGVQSTLFRGTPEEVRTVSKRLLTEMGRGGGYVISPTKPLHEQTLPIGNIAAFLESIMYQ